MRTGTLTYLATVTMILGLAACGEFDDTLAPVSRAQINEKKKESECSRKQGDNDAEGGGSIIISGLTAHNSDSNKKSSTCD